MRSTPLLDVRRAKVRTQRINGGGDSSSFLNEGQSGEEEDSLKKWNMAAGFLHAASGIAALVMTLVYLSGSFMTEITTNFRVYEANATGPVSAGPFASGLRSLGYYRLVWVDLPFPFITAFFHLAIAFLPAVNTYYNDAVFRGGERSGNPLRWLEYSITASLMIWVIMQLSGVTDLFTLLFLGVMCNVALQWMGYIQEQLKGRSVAPTVVGWLIFAGQWAVVFSYFFTAITSPRPMDVERVPWFVYSIVLGLFFLFSLFGAVQLSHLLEWPRFMAKPHNVEKAYIFLSFTAKLFLTWNLLIGMAINPMV